MNKIPMTKRGYDLLQEETRRLKETERPAIVQAIAEAREKGDLSENAEYHAARERQSFIEGRIEELEDKLSRAEVINIAQLINCKEVKFGATVTLSDDDTGHTSTYQIVGTDESDIKQGLLSITSPLARALINKRGGEVVEVLAPNGNKSYEILNIEYIP